MSASYPGSVKSFASRSAGQVIGSAHINDLQDEVGAIETALVTGPINLQASTLASLSVTGGSTFAGAAVFAGSVTFPSTQVFSAVPTVRVTSSGDSGLASAIFTGLNWDVETYDSHGMHSTSVNSSRLTFADSTGVYHLGVSVIFNPNSSGTRAVRVRINDNDAIFGSVGAATPGGTFTVMAASGDIRVTSTADYATVQAWQNSGSTGSVTNSTAYATAFWAHKVSG